ncbi:hypothetical protein CLIB1423_39S00166 [[Candida] railenensis]|uniref:Uncharacterized protein n=1 Tax=[Candida] railenensis TaxID=45579 RepID=A0A9P0QVN4_9ASCO|nr:hypothetical protein CLIB1423_39S00166 [[Candida] railenensis]
MSFDSLKYESPRSSRFFDQSSLPDMKNYVHIQSSNGNRQTLINNQSSNVNYNPYSYPQQKTKSNLPVDFFHLQNRITIEQPSSGNDPMSNAIPSIELNQEQYLNPIKFIESISELGKKYGAVKVIPPKSISSTKPVTAPIPSPPLPTATPSTSTASSVPPAPASSSSSNSSTRNFDETSFKSNFQINADLFWFQTNRLLNNPDGDELDNRLKFHQQLIKFHLLNLKSESSPSPSLSNSSAVMRGEPFSAEVSKNQSPAPIGVVQHDSTEVKSSTDTSMSDEHLGSVKLEVEERNGTLSRNSGTPINATAKSGPPAEEKIGVVEDKENMAKSEIPSAITEDNSSPASTRNDHSIEKHIENGNNSAEIINSRSVESNIEPETKLEDKVGVGLVSLKEEPIESASNSIPGKNGTSLVQIIAPTAVPAGQIASEQALDSSIPSPSTQSPKPKKNQLPSFLNKLPMIDKRPLDLYKLFRSVLMRGGFVEVINKKLWAQIGRELGYRGKIMTSLSSSLKSSYMKILYPFETYLGRKKFDFLGKKNEVEEEETEEIKPLTKKRQFNSDTPLIIGSSKTFKRSVRLKVDKGFLLNSPHLTDVKQPNTISSKRVAQEEESPAPVSPGALANLSSNSSKQNLKRKRSKPAPNSNSDQCIPITAQAQLNQSLQALIENSGVQDASQTTSNGKFSSVYTLRQFMEKDLKFQEFLIQKNISCFNKVPLNGSSINGNAGTLSTPSSPSSVPSSKFSYFNSMEVKETNLVEKEAKSIPPPTPSNSVSVEKNVIPIDKLEEMYWKFVSNSPSEGGDFDVLQEGLELENGVCLPSLVNGSGFVRLGDDLLNYKNILVNVTQPSVSQAALPTSAVSAIATPSTNGSAASSIANSTSHSTTATSAVDNSMQNGIKSSSLPNTSATSTSSGFDGSYYNSSDYCAKMIKSSLNPWNLHNLPILPNSLLGVLGSDDIHNQDLYTPTLNIGMTFSTENWRAEDHLTQLINYQFFGGYKKWYFIPESEFENFENLISEINSKETRIHVNNNEWNYDNLMKYFSGQADCNNIETEALISSLENMIPPYSDSIRLKHTNEKFQELIDIQRKKRSQNSVITLNQDCFINPSILDKHGIRYNYTIQKPGEFIIKFPKTYSSTISFGLNLSEEVNFATSNWLDYAIEGEKWINKQLLLPNFSTFKMLVNFAQLQESHHSNQKIYFDSEVYSKASEVFGKLYTEEIELREKVRSATRNIKEIVDEKLFVDGDSISDDDLQNVLPSKILISSPTESIILSLSRYLECKDFLNNFKVELHLFCSDDKLRHFDKILREYSVDFGSWTAKYEEAMKENVLLPIKSLKGLLADGEKILSATSAAFFNKTGDENSPEYIKFVGYVENLRSFVEVANEFVEECQKVLSVKHQQRIRGKRTGNASLSYSESEKPQSDETLQKLVCLLDQIPTLNFVCPEADQILELKTEIENFERASRSFLKAGSKNSIQEFDDLISLGESFGVNLPTLSFLTRLRERIVWMDHFEVLKSGGDPIKRRGKENNKAFSIDDLRAFSDKGEGILGEEDLDDYREVLKMITKSKIFNEQVSEFLSYNTISDISLDELQRISTEYETESIFLDSTNHEHLMKIRENLNLIEKYLEVKSDIVAEKRKSYKSSEINLLLTTLLESGLNFEVELIKAQLNKTETWTEGILNRFKIGNSFRSTIQKGKDTSNTTKPNISILVEAFEVKNDFNFSFEDDKYQHSSSYNTLREEEGDISTDETNGEDLPPIYCVCREPEAGTMIGCDICKEWYHIQCIQESEKADLEDSDYYACPFCELTNNSELEEDDNIKSKIKLSELHTMVKTGENMLVLPGDLNKIREFTKKCENASLNFTEYLEGIEKGDGKGSSIMHKIDKVRFILRKAYGASINLDEFFIKALHILRDLVKEEQLEAKNLFDSKESSKTQPLEQHSNGNVDDVDEKIKDDQLDAVAPQSIDEDAKVQAINTGSESENLGKISPQRDSPMKEESPLEEESQLKPRSLLKNVSSIEEESAAPQTIVESANISFKPDDKREYNDETLREKASRSPASAVNGQVVVPEYNSEVESTTYEDNPKKENQLHSEKSEPDVQHFTSIVSAPETEK